MIKDVMINRKYCIVGGGGFARETLVCLKDQLDCDIEELRERVVFMTKARKDEEMSIMGIRTIQDNEFSVDDYQVVVGVGNPLLRKEIIEALPKGTVFGTVVHPRATISDWVSIGEGSIISAGTVITCNVNIGKHAQLNLNSTVGHDCVIGDYFTAAPSVNVSGNCIIGDCVYLGTGSGLKQGVSICDEVTIGMGAVVLNDLVQKGVYIGLPAVRLKD